MTLPNPQLCNHYGTGMEKLAQNVAQIAAPLLGIGLMAHDLKHQSNLVAEAERMNESARYFEAKKMEDTISSLGGVMPKQAELEQVGVTLAKFACVDTKTLLEKVAAGNALSGMEKEAIGALLGRLGAGAGKMLSQGGGALTRAGGRLQQAGQAVSKKVPGGAVRPSQGGLGAKPAGGPYRTAAKPSAGQLAPAAASGKEQPLLGGMTKAKLLGTAGLLGAGYAGYKGLQAVRDYMMVPTGARQQWGYGAPLRHNVTAYGY